MSISCNVVSSFVNSQPGVSLLHTAICQTPAFIYTRCGKYTNVSPKIQQTTTQLPITMPNVSTNYQSSCTDRLVCKFDTQCDSLLKLDLHLPQYLSKTQCSYRLSGLPFIHLPVSHFKISAKIYMSAITELHIFRHTCGLLIHIVHILWSRIVFKQRATQGDLHQPLNHTKRVNVSNPIVACTTMSA